MSGDQCLDSDGAFPPPPQGRRRDSLVLSLSIVACLLSELSISRIETKSDPLFPSPDHRHRDLTRPLRSCLGSRLACHSSSEFCLYTGLSSFQLISNECVCLVVPRTAFENLPTPSGRTLSCRRLAIASLIAVDLAWGIWRLGVRPCLVALYAAALASDPNAKLASAGIHRRSIEFPLS